jgi:nucleoside-diphosphate-sugar epimerase
LRRSSGPIGAGLKLIRADLARPETLSRLPQVDCVVYSVGADAAEEGAYRVAFADGPGNLIRAFEEQSRLPRRIFFTSSTGVYGQSGGEWVDETSPADPVHFTGRQILGGERRLLQGRVPATIVRFGGIYGPSRVGFFRTLRRREMSAENQSRYFNLIHREDCIGALTHLISLESPESIYLAVDDRPSQRSEIREWLLSHWPEEEESSPKPPAPTRPRARSNKRCSNARLKASGYSFTYPTFREGLIGVRC